MLVFISTVQRTVTIHSHAFWSIDPAGDQLMTQFQFAIRGEVLNDHGLYELPRIETPGMPPTLRLLINDTEVNNQTVINLNALGKII